MQAFLWTHDITLIILCWTNSLYFAFSIFKFQNFERVDKYSTSSHFKWIRIEFYFSDLSCLHIWTDLDEILWADSGPRPRVNSFQNNQPITEEDISSILTNDERFLENIFRTMSRFPSKKNHIEQFRTQIDCKHQNDTSVLSSYFANKQVISNKDSALMALQ